MAQDMAFKRLFMLIYALVFSKGTLKISEYYIQSKIRFRKVKAVADKIKRKETYEYAYLK